MKTLLKAVRDTLIGDATLLALLPNSQSVASSFVSTDPNYPVITLDVEEGGSIKYLSGLTEADLHITIRSNQDKEECLDSGSGSGRKCSQRSYPVATDRFLRNLLGSMFSASRH